MALTHQHKILQLMSLMLMRSLLLRQLHNNSISVDENQTDIGLITAQDDSDNLTFELSELIQVRNGN